jgi:hypothetical protein
MKWQPKLCLLVSLYNLQASSQELEPRIYAALPKNLNGVVAVYAFQRGNVVTDPSLPVSGVNISVNNISAAYIRTFALYRKLARIQVTVPFTNIAGKLQINGHDTSGSRTGFGDARIRFSINLSGSPAYDRKEFRSYTQRTIFGVGLVTSVPTGLYHRAYRINIGSNRWGFKPEIGISKRFGRFYGEAYTGVWFYTNNNEFLKTKTLEQAPVFSLQGHLAYYFKNMMWVSLNGTWFNGGRTRPEEVDRDDLMDNWRFGGTWSMPLGKGHSVKLQYHFGAFTATDYHFNVLVFGYQYIFY